MDSLRALLDQLEDNRLTYVMARSSANTDAQAIRDAGISRATFYTWPAEEREKLNDIAQRFKRETAERALIVLQDAAVDAADVKVSGLKSRDERVKQSAATEILDRTLGKSTSTLDVNVKQDAPFEIRWSDSEETDI